MFAKPSGSSTYHRQQARASVLDGEVLVLEVGAVDGEGAGTIVTQEVATLDHELGDPAGQLHCGGDAHRCRPKGKQVEWVKVEWTSSMLTTAHRLTRVGGARQTKRRILTH